MRRRGINVVKMGSLPEEVAWGATNRRISCLNMALRISPKGAVAAGYRGVEG
jgi:hypothetical protein